MCLSALNVQWPFSQLLLLGLKRKEARKYALGNRGINVGEMWLVETRAMLDPMPSSSPRRR